MLNIEKFSDEIGDGISIVTNEGAFQIFFDDFLNLHCCVFNNQSNNGENEEEKLTITKENYFIYGLFLELYTNIRKINIDEDDDNTLFNNGVFTLRSYESNNSSVFKIEEVNDTFVVTFIKGKSNNIDKTFVIKYGNCGSRKDLIFSLFMNFYIQLTMYEPENHQVHIEELMYQDKLERKLNK